MYVSLSDGMYVSVGPFFTLSTRLSLTARLYLCGAVCLHLCLSFFPFFGLSRMTGICLSASPYYLSLLLEIFSPCHSNHQVLTVTTSSAVDSGYFVSGSLDRTCRLWTTDRLFPLRTLVGHNLAVETVRFHPNQTYFATGSADKTVRLWTINDGKDGTSFCWVLLPSLHKCWTNSSESFVCLLYAKFRAGDRILGPPQS